MKSKLLRIGIAGFLFLSVIGSTVFTVYPVSAYPIDVGDGHLYGLTLGAYTILCNTNPAAVNGTIPSVSIYLPSSDSTDVKIGM